MSRRRLSLEITEYLASGEGAALPAPAFALLDAAAKDIDLLFEVFERARPVIDAVLEVRHNEALRRLAETDWSK